MLDDVLSAVDAQVARWILKNAILGPLVKQQTRVLCTHNVQVILINHLNFHNCHPKHVWKIAIKGLDHYCYRTHRRNKMTKYQISDPKFLG